MPAPTQTKDPATTGSYTLDWTPYLAPSVNIQTSVWEIPTGSDLTIVTESKTTKTTNVRIGGGTSGNEYAIYNTVTDDNGMIAGRRGFVLRVLDALLIHEESDLEKQLSALRVALGAKAASDTQEYQIANRMKQRYSFEDLLAWEKRLSELVNQERRQAGGPGFFRNVYVRPVEPGP
jgi:hypothetical protein